MEDLKQAWQQLTAPGAPFAWTTRDVGGIPMRTYDSAPPSLHAIWESSRAHGDAEYLIYGDERLSYARAHEIVDSVAASLAARGVGPGDRVAIAMRNYPEWCLAYWATVSLGAAAVGLNAWWTGPEMEYGLKDSTPKLLVCDSERLATLVPHLDAVRAENDLEIVVVRAQGELPVPATHWEELTSAPAGNRPEIEIDPDHDVCIFYTSGTTGSPKGAVMTHRGVVSNLLNLAFGTMVMTAARKNHKTAGAPPDASAPAKLTALLAVPLFHVTGCNCCLHPITAQGGRLILMHKWNAGEALEIIEQERVTVFSGVPMMSRELVEHPDFATRDTSTVSSLGGGGAAVQPDLVEKIEKKLEKGRPGTGYGLTETCGVVSINSGDFFIQKPSTVGPPLPVMEARILDENGQELPPNTVGELVVKGPNNVRGYLNNPEATAEAFPEGWFRTGDLATLDEDNFICIVDRAKDMVLRAGENIYCAEVEAAIFDHPAVKEAAVFAMPHDRFGEVPGAAVVLKEGEQASEEDLQRFVRDRIAAYKVPERFWLMDEELPRNANGKFLKRELKKRLLG